MKNNPKQVQMTYNISETSKSLSSCSVLDLQQIKILVYKTMQHRIIEWFRLEETFKITESNHKPNTVNSTTKPCP